MRTFTKKLLVVLLCISMSFCNSIYAGSIYEKTEITKEELLKLNGEELLSFLEKAGLVLPNDFASHREMAVSFVEMYVPEILNSQNSTTAIPLNYTQSVQLFQNLKETLTALGVYSDTSFHESYM